MNTQHRLVRCPKCRKVLPEPPNVPVYKCGSCSTVLQDRKMRCGGCMKVSNDYVHRYYPEATIAAPPSSEVEDYVGPVSCSDRSFQKSYSTETVLGSLAAMLTGPSSSSRTRGRRKVTSEIEEVEPGPNGSPLHWLMGYASTSKVIRG